MRMSARIYLWTIVLLFVLNIVVWFFVVYEVRPKQLRVSFLDVGQGDAIFVESPSGRQVLIDGGPSSVVLQRLAGVMPWHDRIIDLVIATHPDADHIGGLIDVLERYKAGVIVRSSVAGDTKTAERLMESIHQEGAHEITGVRGQVFDLGDGVYLEILFPDRSVPQIDTNDGCVVVKIVYGKTTFMLPCDAPQSIENYLVYLDGTSLKSDVLKAGHHGSKNSSSAVFLNAVSPSYGIFSRGCTNRYGHPAPEVVDRLEQRGIPTLDTCTDGTITFVSDGQTVHRR